MIAVRAPLRCLPSCEFSGGAAAAAATRKVGPDLFMHHGMDKLFTGESPWHSWCGEEGTVRRLVRQQLKG